MVPLVDEAQVEARFGPIEHSANLDARLVHGSRLTYHRLGNCFGRTRCNSYLTWVMWNLTSFHLEIALVSVQERCTFVPNVPSAQKSFWTHPMVLLANEAQLEARFGPFGDSANLDTRWVHGLR